MLGTRGWYTFTSRDQNKQRPARMDAGAVIANPLSQL